MRIGPRSQFVGKPFALARLTQIKGVAAWVRRSADGRCAIFDYDHAHGLYWYDGRTYSDETTFLAAVGGVIDGASRVIGPWRSTTELLGNTDLVDAAGWVASNGNLTAGAGTLELTGIGSGGAAASASVATLDWTAAYEVAGDVTRVSGGPGVYLGVASSSNLSPFFKQSTQVSSGTVSLSVIFAALQATRSFGIRQSSASLGKSLLSTPRVRLVRPLGRMTTSVLSGRIDFTTPATTLGTQVLMQVDSNDEVCRTRIIYDATGHLRFISTYNSIEGVNFDFGAVTNSASSYIEFVCKQDLTSASLNGGASQQSYVGSAYGMGKLRIGRSYTGEAWDGTYGRVTIYDGENVALSQYIYGEGDSYMIGANDGTALWTALQARGRRVITTAVGGTTLSQQQTRMQSHPSLCKNVFVHWDGDANGYGSTSSDMAKIAAMVAALGHDRFCIIPSCRRSGASGPQNTATTALQGAIATAYPNNYWDAQEYLASIGDPVADAANIAAGNIPSSLLQVDGVHLKSATMDLVAEQVDALIAARGWL